MAFIAFIAGVGDAAFLVFMLFIGGAGVVPFIAFIAFMAAGVVMHGKGSDLRSVRSANLTRNVCVLKLNITRMTQCYATLFQLCCLTTCRKYHVCIH